MRISDWSSDVCSSDLKFVGGSKDLLRGVVDEGLERTVPKVCADLREDDLGVIGLGHGALQVGLHEIPVGKVIRGGTAVSGDHVVAGLAEAAHQSLADSASSPGDDDMAAGAFTGHRNPLSLALGTRNAASYPPACAGTR